MAKLPGIFCLEGEWEADLRRRDSVEPVLELLERLGFARYIHRDVATKAELDYYLSKWCQKAYADFPVLYLAMHGDTGTVSLGKDEVTLEQLGEKLAGRAAGRIVYFASCLTLEDQQQAMDFAHQAGARAVLGYTREVAWLDAAAFEVLLLERLLRGNRSDALLRHLVRDHGAFAADLQLVVATRNKVMSAVEEFEKTNREKAAGVTRSVSM